VGGERFGLGGDGRQGGGHPRCCLIVEVDRSHGGKRLGNSPEAHVDFWVVVLPDLGLMGTNVPNESLLVDHPRPTTTQFPVRGDGTGIGEVQQVVVTGLSWRPARDGDDERGA
jgi:hypothetical protein